MPPSSRQRVQNTASRTYPHAARMFPRQPLVSAPDLKQAVAVTWLECRQDSGWQLLDATRRRRAEHP